MKKWLVFSLVALAGCSATPPASQLYVLPAPEATVRAPQTAPILVVRPVELAPYLDSAGLVYRTSDTQVIQTRQNLWAQNLSAQLTQRLVADLRSKQSQYWPVQLNPVMTSRGQPMLLVRVEQFNGSYTGNADISGEWTLVDAEGQIQQTQVFRHSVPLDSEGYPALVEALAQGFQQVTSQIAQTL